MLRFLAGISLAFESLVGIHSVEQYLPPTTQTAGVAQYPVATFPIARVRSIAPLTLTNAAAPLSAFSVTGALRTSSRKPPAAIGGYVTQSQLTSKLNALTASLVAAIAAGDSAITVATSTYIDFTTTPAYAALLQSIAMTNRVGNLAPSPGSALTITNPTVTGATISNSTITLGSIPDLSSKYLSLSAGGTLTGLTNFANASTTLFSAYGPAYFGATATSTFDTKGNLTLAGTLTDTSTATSSFSGALGIGTTTPNNNLYITTAAASGGLSIDGTNSVGPAITFLATSTVKGYLGLANGVGQYANNAVYGDITLRTQGGKLFFDTNSGNGTAALTIIGGNGSVGVGTTTPWGKLSITGSGTGATDDFVFADSNNSPKFVIQDNGNVGIASTSPFYPLVVSGTAGTNYQIGTASFTSTNSDTQIHLFDNTAGGRDWAINSAGTGSGAGVGNFNISDATAQAIRFSINSSGNVGIGTTNPRSILNAAGTNPNISASTTDVTVNSAAFFNAYSDSSQFQFASHGSARTISRWGLTLGGWDEIYSGNNLGTSNGLVIGTNNAAPLVFGTSNAERMRIDSSGNLGIGNTNPNRLLTVGTPGGTGSSVMSVSGGSAGSGAGGSYLIEEVSGVPLLGLGNASSLLGGAFSNDLILYNASSTADRFYTNAAERMRIDSSGNVGIGTTTPASIDSRSKLDIYSTNSVYPMVSTNSTSNDAAWLYYDTSIKAYAGVMESSNCGAGWTVYISGCRFLVNSSGNVGIGTTTPSFNLDVFQGATSITNNAGLMVEGSNETGVRLRNYNYNAYDIFSGGGGNSVFNNKLTFFDRTNNLSRMVIDNSGNVGVGTTTPYARLTVWGSDAASSTLAFNVVNNASTTVFAVFDGGNAQLSGTLTQSSDVRLKTGIQSLDASSSLAEVLALNPVSYQWQNNIFGSGDQLGFIAQDVQDIFPQLVATTSPTALTPGGTLGLNYTGLIAPIVGAIKALATEMSSLEATVAGFARSFTTHKLCVAGDNGAQTCIDQQQLATLLAEAGQGNAAETSATSTTASSTAPVIALSGNNPATISVGDIYVDLGATIAAPAADLKLGIRASVDGGATTTPEQIQIDTATASTHTILYCAIDQTGLSGCATRTVVVQAQTLVTLPVSSTATPTGQNSTSTMPSSSGTSSILGALGNAITGAGEAVGDTLSTLTGNTVTFSASSTP